MASLRRVLIVDDYGPWRSHVRRVLEATHQWDIVGEAADGPEAIQQALDLKPDLILLDVGLPTLSGIRVAERILAANSTQRILFISEHRSLAEGALATGALGYIIKSDAAFELLPAMDAVACGRRYVGANAAEDAFDIHTEPAARHEACFYEDEGALVGAWVQAAEPALRAGHTFILVAIESRRCAVQQQLEARGVDVARAMQEKRYVTFDIADMLSQFMVDDWPDDLLFQQAVTPLLVDALGASTARSPRVMVCGECAPSLLKEGHSEAAVRIEQLWEGLTGAYEIDTLCGYLVDRSTRADTEDVLRRISAIHSAVYS